jgi:formylglycine-generating enzyme required for sulfatase activity/dienelactone hydrolase
MRDFLDALRRRRVFRTAAAYAVIAWGAVQVVLTVAPELGLPVWSGRAAIWLALAGFPVALALSWAYDLTERGMRWWRAVLLVVVLLLVLPVPILIVLRDGSAPSEAEIEALLDEATDSASAGAYLAAFELLERTGLEPSHDDRVARLYAGVTEVVDVDSEPQGARVRIAVWRPGDPSPEDDLRDLGVTPMRDIRLPRTIHYVRFELEGHLPFERSLDVSDWQVGGEVATRRIALAGTLRPEGSAHPEMVAVPGGSYTLASADVPLGLTAVVDAFLIDRFEVTNEQYAEFVRARGYDDRRYWSAPFVDGVDTLTFEEAMNRLVDRTGLPAPRGWSGQEYPPGTGRHPVTGVSWYEASAYAAYRGMELPTAFQWEKAARDGRHAFGDVLMPWGVSSAGLGPTLANFGGEGTVPVDAMPFGISVYGVHAMAGNALEWLRNPSGEGRAVTGGSWGGPPYTYSEFSGFEPFFASPYLGFRLVYLESDRQRLSVDQGAGPLDFTLEAPRYDPVSRDEARALRAYFDYDPVELDPVVSDRTDEGAWIRESLSVRSPYGDRIPVTLYLPKAALPPYQTFVYVPSGAALMGSTVPEDTEQVMGPVVRSGRAVLAVALSGMVGHEFPPERDAPSPSSVRFRDEVVRNAVEMRVGIDYLETRPDIDVERVGYAAFSFGAGSRGTLLAADSRFSLALLHGAGIDERVRPVRPEVDPVNYAPYYELPILIVQGQHDEEHPYETRFLPLLELLPEDRITLELVEGAGHLVPAEDRVPAILRFLEEHWGPVAR